jgi:outer membrane murein-binding lipoprotein Lpp
MIVGPKQIKIEELIRRVNQMSLNIASLQADVAAVTSALQAALADKAALAQAEADLAAAQTEIDNLSAQLKAVLPAAP